jgi:hypothetical protein
MLYKKFVPAFQFCVSNAIGCKITTNLNTTGYICLIMTGLFPILQEHLTQNLLCGIKISLPGGMGE